MFESLTINMYRGRNGIFLFDFEKPELVINCNVYDWSIMCVPLGFANT